jgi:hypothetical protein
VNANRQGCKHVKDFEAQKAITNLNQEEGAVLQIQEFHQTNIQNFAFWEQETCWHTKEHG